MHQIYWKFISFADDTTILCSHANIQGLEKTLNHGLSKLNNWFSANELSLYVARTNYMTTKNRGLITDIDVTSDGTNITEVKATKFLGLNRLSSKNHINFVLTKLSKTTAIMYHASRFLNQNTLRTNYCSFFFLILIIVQIYGETTTYLIWIKFI